MAHNAKLNLSCKLLTFDPKTMDYVYDALEHHQQDEIRCLPVLELISERHELRQAIQARGRIRGFNVQEWDTSARKKPTFTSRRWTTRGNG
ncbi:hypothetical protein HZ326_18395 [Fusarium oxysporum f. sp. albedinis]|nr:hypothetical protein HZ326_18395 [Fusarium oxysporum f. sp. albedinis]